MSVGLRTCTESCMVQIIQRSDTNVVPDKSTKSVIKQLYIKVLSGVGRSPTSGTNKIKGLQRDCCNPFSSCLFVCVIPLNGGTTEWRLNSESTFLWQDQLACRSLNITKIAVAVI